MRRSLFEFGSDLEHLSRTMARMVQGVERPPITNDWQPGSSASYSNSELLIQGQEVMQTWERPLMEALAQSASDTHGDVLEVGFGIGLSAGMIQGIGVRSHTIIKSNKQVIRQFDDWRRSFPGRAIRLIDASLARCSSSVGPL